MSPPAPAGPSRPRVAPAIRPALLAGAAGSALVALGGVGAGALPRLDGPLRLPSSTAGHVAGVALAAVGVVLLTAAWWRLRSRLPGLAPRDLLVLTAGWSAPLLVAPPLLSRDVYAYAGQAQLVVQGLDPYDVGPGAVVGPLSGEVDPVWLSAPAPYGPVWMGLAAAVVRVTGESVVPAVLGMRLLAVAGLVLTAWALPRLAVAHGVPPQRALWLGLANPLGLLHGVGGAHNDALMVGLLVAGLAVACGGRPATRPIARLALAAAVVTLAALVKVPAVVALAYLPLLATAGVRARLRAGLVVLAAAVGTAVLATLASGVGWGWLTSLDAGRARLSLLSPTTGLGVAAGSALEAAGVVQDADAVLDVVLAAGLLLAAAVSLALLVRALRTEPLLALGLTLLVVVVLAPVVQPWYLLWAAVPLAAVTGPRAAAGLAGASLLLCFLVLPTGRHLVRPPLYGVPALLAAAAGAVAVRREGVSGRAAVRDGGADGGPDDEERGR